MKSILDFHPQPGTIGTDTNVQTQVLHDPTTTQNATLHSTSSTDPITTRINQIFEELKPDLEEDSLAQNVGVGEPVNRRQGKGRQQAVRAMNTVSGYFGDWTRYALYLVRYKRISKGAP